MELSQKVVNIKLLQQEAQLKQRRWQKIMKIWQTWNREWKDSELNDEWFGSMKTIKEQTHI